jgi:hypothetical protein
MIHKSINRKKKQTRSKKEAKRAKTWMTYLMKSSDLIDVVSAFGDK